MIYIVIAHGFSTTECQNSSFTVKWDGKYQIIFVF